MVNGGEDSHTVHSTVNTRAMYLGKEKKVHPLSCFSVEIRYCCGHVIGDLRQQVTSETEIIPKEKWPLWGNIFIK